MDKNSFLDTWLEFLRSEVDNQNAINPFHCHQTQEVPFVISFNPSDLEADFSGKRALIQSYVAYRSPFISSSDVYCVHPQVCFCYSAVLRAVIYSTRNQHIGRYLLLSKIPNKQELFAILDSGCFSMIIVCFLNEVVRSLKDLHKDIDLALRYGTDKNRILPEFSETERRFLNLERYCEAKNVNFAVISQ